MLVIPLAIDQPVQAHYVANAGFGLALRPEEISEDTLGSALRTLLDPRHGHADRVQALKGKCGDSARAIAERVVEGIFRD